MLGTQPVTAQASGSTNSDDAAIHTFEVVDLEQVSDEELAGLYGAGVITLPVIGSAQY